MLNMTSLLFCGLRAFHKTCFTECYKTLGIWLRKVMNVSDSVELLNVKTIYPI